MVQALFAYLSCRALGSALGFPFGVRAPQRDRACVVSLRNAACLRCARGCQLERTLWQEDSRIVVCAEATHLPIVRFDYAHTLVFDRFAR